MSNTEEVENFAFDISKGEIRSTAYSLCYLVSKTSRYVSQRLANDVQRET